jgi:hypothetical protein
MIPVVVNGQCLVWQFEVDTNMGSSGQLAKLKDWQSEGEAFEGYWTYKYKCVVIKANTL